MRNVLALDYRPARFADVVGQGHVVAILRAMVSTEKVPPALVFSGTRGTGKTTCARIFSAALNCLDQSEGDACGRCAQCLSIQNQTSSSVIEIDAASNGGVDEVRRIKDQVLYSHDGNWRVIVLDEAQSMSNAAYHALLKVLEEPPERTVFVLCTTEPEKILGTVRSRAMPFEFRRIRTSDVEERLLWVAAAEQIEADTSLFSEIARVAQGGLRDALMLLDQVSRVGVRSGEDFCDFFGVRDYSTALMWAALRGDHGEGLRLVHENFSRTGEAAGMVADLSRLVSQLLVLKSQGVPPDLSEDAYAERADMAQAVTSEALIWVIEILWDLRSRIRASENDQRSSMEMAFSLIAHRLKPFADRHEETAAPILPANESGDVLTLDQIREMSSGR